MRNKLFMKVTAFAAAAAFSCAGFMAAPATNVEAAGLTQVTDASKVNYGKVTDEQIEALKKIFDLEYYKKSNPELASKIKDNYEAWFSHFYTYGIFEGRTCSANFDPSAYASAYGDLRNEFRSDIMKYYLHYINAPEGEKRTITTLEACAKNNITVQSIIESDIKITPEVYNVAQKLGVTNGNEIADLSRKIDEAAKSGATQIVVTTSSNDSNNDNGSDNGSSDDDNSNDAAAASSAANSEAASAASSAASSEAAGTDSSATSQEAASADSSSASPEASSTDSSTSSDAASTDSSSASSDASSTDSSSASSDASSTDSSSASSDAASTDSSTSSDPATDPSGDNTDQGADTSKFEGYTHVATLSVNGGIDIIVYHGGLQSGGYGAYQNDAANTFIDSTPGYDKDNEILPGNENSTATQVAYIPVYIFPASDYTSVTAPAGVTVSDDTAIIMTSDENGHESERVVENGVEVTSNYVMYYDSDNNAVMDDAASVADTNATSETTYDVSVQFTENTDGSTDFSVGIESSDTGLTIEDTYTVSDEVPEPQFGE